MPRSGLVNTRTKPRVKVLRGFDPNAPMTLTQSLPAASSGNNTIYSGQLITAAWDTSISSYAWSQSASGLSSTGVTPYIALQDTADQDVSEAGKLTGLSCAGQFEIQTAYYTGTSTNFTVGKIVVPGTTGNVTVASGTGALILGHITRAPIGEGMQPGIASEYAPITITASYATSTGASFTGAGAVFYPGTDSSAVAPAVVITFATAYNGTKTVA